MVRLSCSQWRKEDEPSDGPPASGSVMTTAKVAPLKLLSSARLGIGAVSVPFISIMASGFPDSETHWLEVC